MLFQLSHPVTPILSFKSLVNTDCGREKKNWGRRGEKLQISCFPFPNTTIHHTYNLTYVIKKEQIIKKNKSPLTTTTPHTS